MHRALTLLLCAYLLVAVPAGFASELFSTWPSLGMRGAPAVLELGLHAVGAVICATAGYLLLTRAPAAWTAGMVAVVADAAESLQSLYWTSLPRQTAPGERVPLTIFVAALALFWLWVLRRGARSSGS
jgi:hypothetical protein